MRQRRVDKDRRELKKVDTRRALTEAANELFRSHGYQNTTVGQIVDLAEVSERTFFRYFESKEDLLLPELVDFLDRIAMQFELSSPDQKPLQALMESVRTVILEQRANGQSPLLQVPALSETVPATRVAKIFLNWEARIISLMKTKVRTISPEVGDPDVVAVVVARCGIAAMRTTFEVARSLAREGRLTPNGVVDVLERSFSLVSSGCVVEG